MSEKALPDLKGFMDKRVQVKVKGGRVVSGELRGVDHFMNLVLHNATDETRRPYTDGNPIPMGETVLRGNIVVDIVCLQA